MVQKESGEGGVSELYHERILSVTFKGYRCEEISCKKYFWNFEYDISQVLISFVRCDNDIVIM